MRFVPILLCLASVYDTLLSMVCNEIKWNINSKNVYNVETTLEEETKYWNSTALIGEKNIGKRKMIGKQIPPSTLPLRVR